MLQHSSLSLLSSYLRCYIMSAGTSVLAVRSGLVQCLARLRCLAVHRVYLQPLCNQL